MTLQNNRKTGFFGSVGFAIAAASATAYAQDGAQPVLEEVTVTAQKRAENLQDVPVAVSAASAEMLSDLEIENVLEVEQVVPGLTYTTNAAQASPRIRGIGTSISAAGNEQAVATYVDGVYYASALGSIVSFNNIEQVAVLKGPQGTLFGRNTTGGLIQITTRDPGQEFAGEAELLYGNLDTIGADLYLSGGISDRAAADVAIHYQDQKEGFGTNLFNGRDVNRGDELSIRSKWRVALGADTNATFIADYGDSKSTGAVFRTKPGELPITGLPGPVSDFDTNTNTQPFSDIEQYGFSLKLTHDFQTMQFLSISAYRHTDWETLFDNDGHQVFILRARVSELDRQVSQEFQLLSTGEGPLQWVVGAYYFDASGGFLPGIVDVVPSGLINTLFSKQKTESYSVFGQGTYPLSDATSVTAGLRWTTEDKSIDGSGALFFPATGFTVPVGPIEAKETIDEPTYRLAIDHQLTDNVMAYASYNHGFKSGGYDPSSVRAAVYVKPEELDAIEAGMKAEVLDRRLRLNGAAYYYDYTNLQLNTFVNGLLTVYNGDSAEVYGLDLDLAAAPTDRLTLTLGLASIHGRYGDFPVTQTASLPTGGIIALPDASADGKRLVNTPDWTVNLGANYKVPLSNGSLTFATNLYHSDGWYNAPENRTRMDSYDLVNASMTWAFGADEMYSAKLWGRNLGDEFVFSSITNQVPVTDMVTGAPGRTYGLTLGMKF
jgi:iron complex outermembrane recepter protein